MTVKRPRAANPAASIEDWLNLVDPDGAFLTPTGLKAVFPHGFDPMPTDQRAELRSRVAELSSSPTEPGAELRHWLLEQCGLGAARRRIGTNPCR